MNKPQLSIIVPVFNSSAIAPRLFERVRTSLAGYSWELVMVNDGSADNSWEVISGLAAVYDNVVAIDLRLNCGQDNAIMAGIRESCGDHVVIMDDDLQHDPADICALYDECLKGYEVVFADFKPWKQSGIRKAGSRLNAGFASWLLGRPRGLYLSPFKILTRNLADELTRFVGPYPYIDGMLLSLTRNISSVRVHHHARHSGHSNYTMRRSGGVWFRLFTGFSVAPLRLAAVAGLAIALFGLGLMAYYLYEYFFGTRIVEGWTSIVLLLIFFGGITLMMLGLLGIYIGRIYLTLGGKPQYSVRKIIRKGEAS
jgi:polyisoprenyl-phosphate glycosyltransferase